MAKQVKAKFPFDKDETLDLLMLLRKSTDFYEDKPKTKEQELVQRFREFYYSASFENK